MPEPSLPTVIKRVHCTKCAAVTGHKLKPCAQGASFCCETCGHSSKQYSHAEMASIVMRQLFKLPPNPQPVDIPEGMRVFLEHHGPSADEMEASQKSVKNHVAVTGQLPVVGKPLYAPIDASKKLALPYGKVVRIEVPE